MRTSSTFFIPCVAICTLIACQTKQSIIEEEKYTTAPVYTHQHTPPIRMLQGIQEVVLKQSSSLVPNWNEAFYRVADSTCFRVDPFDYLKKQLRYPEICKELEIQGKWYCELHFDQHHLIDWTVRRSPENAVHMTKEVDRVLSLMQRELSYIYPKTDTAVLLFDMRLERN